MSISVVEQCLICPLFLIKCCGILTFWFWAVIARVTCGTVGGARWAYEARGTQGLALVGVWTPIPLVTHGTRFLSPQRVVARLTGCSVKNQQNQLRYLNGSEIKSKSMSMAIVLH